MRLAGKPSALAALWLALLLPLGVAHAQAPGPNVPEMQAASEPIMRQLGNVYL